jgi:hypothetical protein
MPMSVTAYRGERATRAQRRSPGTLFSGDDHRAQQQAHAKAEMQQKFRRLKKGFGACLYEGQKLCREVITTT